jgi:hypothetical protein
MVQTGAGIYVAIGQSINRCRYQTLNERRDGYDYRCGFSFRSRFVANFALCGAIGIPGYGSPGPIIYDDLSKQAAYREVCSRHPPTKPIRNGFYRRAAERAPVILMIM